MSFELKAKEILETGEIKLFVDFLDRNGDKIQINRIFQDGFGYPVILIQTYRKAESLTMGRRIKIEIDEYKDCLRLLVGIGCDLNNQDDMGRTFAHWTILLNCLEFLSIALELGCNTLLQDSEGETIVHLAIRHNNQVALETIKLYARNTDVFETPSDTSGATPLIYAVQIGAVDIVKKLLQLSVNVDSQENNEYRRTALHYALFTDNEELFALLLKYKARPDIKDYKDKSVINRVAEYARDNYLRILTNYCGRDVFSIIQEPTEKAPNCSPISLACKNGNFADLCKLIEIEKQKSPKLDLNIEDTELRTPLHHCAENYDTKCAEKLIELDPKLIERKDKNGFTALHLATIANNKNLVELLLNKGSNTREKDNDGHTSLHWAVVCCATELMDLLLKKDPEIAGIIDNHGATPLHYATQSFLNPEGSVQGPIVIEKLLKNNREMINCVDHDNRTPLIWAATLGLANCCQLLLENGANKDHRDNNGLSALHCAASRGHYDVVDLLVNTYKMLADITDKNLCTPLFYAVTLNHMAVIRYLLEQKSNPNHQDIKGRSIAHCAAIKGYRDILDLVQKFGGSLNLKNNIGDLPLHEAAETGKFDVCKLLLEKKTEKDNINDMNQLGYSPLHKAAQHNFNSICQLLVNHGADVNLLTAPKSRVKGGPDVSNLTPMDLATDSATKTVLKGLNGKTSKGLKGIIEETTEEVEDNIKPQVVSNTQTQEPPSLPSQTSNNNQKLQSTPVQHAQFISKQPFNTFNYESSARKPTNRNNYEYNNNKNKSSNRYPERSFPASNSLDRNSRSTNFSNNGRMINSRSNNRRENSYDNSSFRTDILSVSSESVSMTNSLEDRPAMPWKRRDEIIMSNVIQSNMGGGNKKEIKKKPFTVGKYHSSDSSKFNGDRNNLTNNIKSRHMYKENNANYNRPWRATDRPRGYDYNNSYGDNNDDMGYTDSSYTTPSSTNSRRTNKSKGIDLSSKIVKSVREYETVRGQSRSLSDQKRQELFQANSRSYKLDRMVDKSAINFDYSRRSTDELERPEYELEEARKRALFPKAHNKEEQIRMAYDGRASISTATIYSYIP